MQTIVIIADILMFFYIFKIIIDLNILTLKLRKKIEKEKQSNELEENYQFIKGLY
ncbi:MAG: hypothetical protein PHQ74_10960 [Crocinitomicaceae bacterium]|nr:hypothetical protein [Crocinitomicaceae bacterium]